MEGLVIIALAFTIPLAAAAVRPTRGMFAVVLAIGLGVVTYFHAADGDFHPSQADDLAWAAITYGLMCALVVGGWLVGRLARRRTRPAGAGPA